ncbi:MAG: O-antigen ligase protein [Microbacteriaceae bacterium]|jgi:exopolysaccharide production protein ExoQ|nr:O-antigen ligase protein [Microbacteriaceae bacterium]
MRALDNPRFRFGLLTFALVTVLAGDIWRYTVTWVGFGVVVLVVSVFAVMLLVRNAARWRLGGLPYSLLAFTVLIVVSVLWSAYPGATVVGVVATLLTLLSAVAFAVSYSWAELLRSLGLALRILISGSLLFELFVSVVLRHPLLPLWYEYPDGPLAKSLYWSRDLLLDGGKIQGLPGNSALLGFLALLALIVFGAQLVGRTTRRIPTLVWLALAALTIYLTRSATITLALAAVVVVALAIVAIRSARSTRIRAVLYSAFFAVAAALSIAAVVLRDPLLALLGKQPDLTGRSNIWAFVTDLAQQRPVLGWGWVSYWAPWAAPLNTLPYEGGVQQFQAHNAWLDIWLQLGFVGLAVFGFLVVSTVVRAWLFAADRRITVPGTLGTYTVESVVPILVLTALVVQSLAESRLLIEYGMLLLVVIAVKTKLGDRLP